MILTAAVGLGEKQICTKGVSEGQRKEMEGGREIEIIPSSHRQLLNDFASKYWYTVISINISGVG